MPMNFKAYPSDPGLPEGFFEVRAIARADHASFGEDPTSVIPMFHEANPWFAAGGRAGAWVLPGQARLAAFLPSPGEIDGKRAAFFGFFECVEGHDDAMHRLLDAAIAWAREGGAEVLYGPIDFSTYGAYRFKTGQEPDGLPFLGEPDNPERYPELLDAYGASLEMGYLTQIFDDEGIAARRAEKEPVRKALIEAGFTFGAMTHELWLDNLPEMHEMANAVFGGNFAYTPLPYALFAHACGPSYIGKTDPEVSAVCFDPDGAIAGMFLIYPHYGALLPENPNLLASDVSFATHGAQANAAQREPTGVFKTVGVNPKHRRRGIMDALILEVLDRGAERYTRWFAALIRDDNPSRNFAETSYDRERRYALYRLDVPSNVD